MTTPTTEQLIELCAKFETDIERVTPIEARSVSRALRQVLKGERGDVCGVCAGTGKPVSGKPCICKGVGTLHAENLGLREYILEIESVPSPRVADSTLTLLKKRRDRLVDGHSYTEPDTNATIFQNSEVEAVVMELDEIIEEVEKSAAASPHEVTKT